MRLTLRILLAPVFAAALVLFLVSLPAPAQAQVCSASVTDFAFGTVSLRSGSENRTAGRLTVSCAGGVLGGAALPVGVCVTFGGGSASDGGSPPRRYLVGPGGALMEYQLYRAGLAGAPLHRIFLEIVMIGGSGSASVPIDAAILSRGVSLPTGVYAATYPAGGTAGVRLRTGVLSCDVLAAENAVPGFRVSAEAASSCEVRAGTVDFGQIGGTIAAHVDATGTVEVSCTADTPYRVFLSQGSGHGVTGPAARRLTSPLGSLVYGLFLDAARSRPWGDTVATGLEGIGIGGAQAHRVFGRIFSGQTAPAGVYSDRIVVTVAY